MEAEKKIRTEQMIEAMKMLKMSVDTISELWQDYSGECNGETEFDYALNEKYPFSDAFFEMHYAICDWTESCIKKLEEGDGK